MRQHMSPADRAKQFLPFAALKGYEESLREYARVRVERVCLAEDAQAELDLKLRGLMRGAEVSALYYYNGEYIERRGVFMGVDTQRRRVLIGEEKISLDDLLDIR